MSKRISLSCAALVLAVGVTLSACSTAPTAPAPAPASVARAAAPAPSYPPSINQLVATAKSQVKTIKMSKFTATFDKKDVGLLIDVRNQNEFEDGFVPGALNVPCGLIEFRIWKLVGFPDKTNMNTKMMLYCATGGRCALAIKSLQGLGFTNVTSVDIKFEDWVKAGNPVAMPKK